MLLNLTLRSSESQYWQELLLLTSKEPDLEPLPVLKESGPHHTPVRLIILIVAVREQKPHPSLHNCLASLAVRRLPLSLGCILPGEPATKPDVYVQAATA